MNEGSLLSTIKFFLKLLNMSEFIPNICLESTFIQGTGNYLLFCILFQWEGVFTQTVATPMYTMYILDSDWFDKFNQYLLKLTNACCVWGGDL